MTYRHRSTSVTAATIANTFRSAALPSFSIERRIASSRSRCATHRAASISRSACESRRAKIAIIPSIVRIGLTYNLKPEGAVGDRFEEFDSVETIEALESALRECGHD